MRTEIYNTCHSKVAEGEQKKEEDFF